MLPCDPAVLSRHRHKKRMGTARSIERTTPTRAQEWQLAEHPSANSKKTGERLQKPPPRDRAKLSTEKRHRSAAYLYVILSKNCGWSARYRGGSYMSKSRDRLQVKGAKREIPTPYVVSFNHFWQLEDRR